MATLESGRGATGEVTTTNAVPTQCLTGGVPVAPGEIVYVEGIAMVAAGSVPNGVTVRMDATAVRTADGTILSVYTAGSSVGGDTVALPGVTAEWVANGNNEIVPLVTGVAVMTLGWLTTSRYNKRVP